MFAAPYCIEGIPSFAMMDEMNEAVVRQHFLGFYRWPLPD
jgi:hypothetical protein